MKQKGSEGINKKMSIVLDLIDRKVFGKVIEIYGDISLVNKSYTLYNKKITIKNLLEFLGISKLDKVCDLLIISSIQKKKYYSLVEFKSGYFSKAILQIEETLTHLERKYENIANKVKYLIVILDWISKKDKRTFNFNEVPNNRKLGFDSHIIKEINNIKLAYLKNKIYLIKRNFPVNLIQTKNYQYKSAKKSA